MKTVPPLDFSNLIAFLLPGFVGFYSLTYFSSRAAELFSAGISEDGNAGIWIAVTLFSLTAGVIVSAVRVLFLDALQFRTGVSKRDLD